MATYIWNGGGFTGQVFVPSGFFGQPDGTTVYYDQNRQAFYKAQFVNGVPQYDGSMSVNVLPNTILQSNFALASNVGSFGTQIINEAYEEYLQNPINLVNNYAQNQGSLVSLAVQQALSSNPDIGQAYSEAAPTLTSPPMNFAANEISKNWPDGATALANLRNVVANLQGVLSGIESDVQSVVDFKTKIFQGQIGAANETRKLQGQIEDWVNKNTFTNLVSAFPTPFGTLVQSLANSDQHLTNVIANLLPSSGQHESTVIANALNRLFGSKIPIIVNPIDKIRMDMTKLTGIVSEGDNLINQGFATLDSHLNFINQVTTLLENYVGKAENALSQLKPTPAQSVAPALLSLAQAANLNLQQQLAQTIAQTQSWVQSYAGVPSSAIGQINGQSGAYDAKDPWLGGSFTNLTSAVGGFTIPNGLLTVPNITTTSDPSLAQAQTQNTIAQNSAAQASSQTMTVVRGTSFNDLDVPLSRNYTQDGSLGDFKTSISYQL